MDTNITFRIDSQTKAKMTELCNQLGMTPSAAFNIFANAFVRCKGMPFPVRMDESSSSMSSAQILKDTDLFLNKFSEDYRRMAE